MCGGGIVTSFHHYTSCSIRLEIIFCVKSFHPGDLGNKD